GGTTNNTLLPGAPCLTGPLLAVTMEPAAAPQNGRGAHHDANDGRVCRWGHRGYRVGLDDRQPDCGDFLFFRTGVVYFTRSVCGADHDRRPHRPPRATASIRR